MKTIVNAKKVLQQIIDDFSYEMNIKQEILTFIRRWWQTVTVICVKIENKRNSHI